MKKASAAIISILLAIIMGAILPFQAFATKSIMKGKDGAAAE